MSLELEAVLRQRTGKGAARSVRRDLMVPAVLYGPKTPSTKLSVSSLLLEKFLRDTGGESKLLNLKIDGGESRQVLIREIQTHPYRRRFLHVDFYEVPLDQPISVEVVVELVGDSVGVQKGGEVNLIQRTLAVRCLPNQIPESIRIDISKLDLGDMLHVEDLVAESSYVFDEDPSTGVVSVEGPESAAQSSGEGAEK
ncbi:MAG: 50S ribosomal protein L25 [Deltaproteobacteria bacterium]|jgi:large subunit ribosomal protein L25|nr:50S ribosomal protein L25 [Deltaproteobacteria bacterium]